jgi:hypothetical protein
MIENSGAFAPNGVLCSRDREDVEDAHDDGGKNVPVSSRCRQDAQSWRHLHETADQQRDIKSVRVGKRVLVPRQYLDEYLSTLIGSTRSAS